MTNKHTRFHYSDTCDFVVWEGPNYSFITIRFRKDGQWPGGGGGDVWRREEKLVGIKVGSVVGGSGMVDTCLFFDR